LDHPELAKTLSNRAYLLLRAGDHASAEPLYRRALAIQEKALGPDHASLAVGLNNFAHLLQTKGDYAGAEPLYQRALAIAEKNLGNDHPTTKSIRQNLEVVRRAQLRS